MPRKDCGNDPKFKLFSISMSCLLCDLCVMNILSSKSKGSDNHQILRKRCIYTNRHCVIRRDLRNDWLVSLELRLELSDFFLLFIQNQRELMQIKVISRSVLLCRVTLSISSFSRSFFDCATRFKFSSIMFFSVSRFCIFRSCSSTYRCILISLSWLRLWVLFYPCLSWCILLKDSLWLCLLWLLCI